MTHADGVEWLRGLSARDLDWVLRAARICTGWTYTDDEDATVTSDDDDFFDAVHFGSMSLLARGGYRAGFVRRHPLASEASSGWEWRLEDPSVGVHPRGRVATFDDAQEALELAALAAGYRLPWRLTCR